MSNQIRYGTVIEGLPHASLNDINPDPTKHFATIDFGTNLDFYASSDDPAWCRHVARQFDYMAELLEADQARQAIADSAPEGAL